MPKDLIRLLQKQDLSESTVMAFPYKEARRLQGLIRGKHGLVPYPSGVPLLTEPKGNVKLQHSSSDRVASYGLTLLPADSSLLWNTCRWATQGCKDACLATSGQAGMEMRSGKDRIFRARLAKVHFLAEHPQAFLRCLAREVDLLPVDKWKSKGFTVSLRMNVLADLDWSLISPWIITRAINRSIAVYDYSKDYKRAKRASVLGWDLSMSVHEKTTDAQIQSIRRPVVVVDISRTKPVPEIYLGRTTVDGDRSDARYLDPLDSIVLLRYKHVSACTKEEALDSNFVRQV